MKFGNKNLKNREQGQVVLTVVILFLMASLVIVLGVATPILKHAQISTNAVHSEESYYLAEGALEDAYYRLLLNKTVSTGDTVTLNGYTATLSVTTSSTGKTIDVTADRGNLIRKMEASFTTGVGASFNYGIQTGTGGFTLAGGSRINGNVYANGSIIATNGVTITGTAIAANSASLVSDQSNSGTVPISSCTSSTCINFRDTSASQDFAQSFKVSSTTPLHDIKFYIKKVGAPSDITLHLVADNAGSPGTTDLFGSTQTFPASSITTSFGWVDYTFTDNPSLNPSQTYWLVLDNSSNNSSNYYQVGATSGGYANGTGKIGKYSGAWTNTSPSGLDSYFNLYLGGLNSTIGSGTYVGSVVVGSGSIGDAWAHTVSGASVAGTIYCTSGTNNNKACNTSRADPSSSGLPLSDANLQEFKDEGTSTLSGWTYSGNLTIGFAGTTTTTLHHVTGNLTINGGGTADMTDLQVDGNVDVGSGATLKVGPMKVNGTLSVTSSLTQKGTIYVVGNVSFTSGSTYRLDSGYSGNSGVLITDGIMTLTGGSNFYGSGSAGSYPLIITTSACPNAAGCGGVNAIEFSGGSGAVILNAQSGTLHMSGGTNAKELTANEISVDSGGTVTYDSGIANLNFTSGPSGGWNVSTWKEVQ